jgi:hypothetical protein
MCGNHPSGNVHRACQTDVQEHVQSQSSVRSRLTATFSRLWADHPLPVAGGLIAIVPLVAVAGMSFLAFLASLVLPLVIPVAALVGVRRVMRYFVGISRAVSCNVFLFRMVCGTVLSCP